MSPQDPKHNKRASTGQASSPALIPRAPPLPVQKPLQRARNAASRFLGYPSRPSSPTDERDEGRFAHGGIGARSATLGATQNATASHRTGLECRTISINERGTHAVIAGKELFKTVRIEDSNWVEDFNLRTAIRSTPTTAAGAPRHIFSIDIADVAWAKGDSGDYIAAATSSGKIILYDLGHAGLQAAQLHEHFRQVHNVTFNPHRGNLLLSGSQDGTVRLWDVRDVRSQANAIGSKRTFSGQSGGVRDVKWSPTEGCDFAFGTDNGEIQRWDIRNLKTAKIRIPAHSLTCNTIDWHPDGKHILSAGADKIVRVFDVSASRPRKASWEIRTPHPVMLARWRPSCRSSMPQDNGAQQCTQIATAYDREHPVMHIWDFRRPLLPFREMQPYPSAPTDMLWHSQDLLWTVGREGTLLQTDTQHIPKVIDRCNLQAFGISPLGELSFVAQARQRRRMPKSHRIPSLTPTTDHSASAIPDADYGLSRSWVDDSLDRSFLDVLPMKRHNRASSNSRAHAASVTSALTQNNSVIRLDNILGNRKSFRPEQKACRGLLPGHNNHNYIAHMAERLKLSIMATSSDDEYREHIREAFKANADLALSVGFWPLSQSFKIAGLMLDNHLRDRAVLKRKKAREKVRSHGSSHLRYLSADMEKLAISLAAHHLRSPIQSARSLRPVSTIAQQLAMPESTSNVPTPLVRPSVTGKAANSHHDVQLLEFDKDDKLALPPSLASAYGSVSSKPGEQNYQKDRKLTISNLTDLVNNQSTTDAAERQAMVNRWNVPPIKPLKLDDADIQGVRIPPAKLEKHDSAESFQFLEDSGGSRGPSFPASLASSRSGNDRMVAERPSRRQLLPALSYPVSVNDGQSMFFEGSGTLGNSGITTMENSGHISKLDSKEYPDDDDDDWEDEPITADCDMPDVEETEFKHHRAVALDIVSSPRHVDQPPGILRDAAEDHNVLNRVPHQESVHTGQHRAAESNPFRQVPTGSGADDGIDIDIEEGKAVWTLIEMLQQLVKHYTINLPFPQAATSLILLLGPILPRTHPLPIGEINQTISGYVDYFLQVLGWDAEDIPSLIKQCYDQPIKAGLQPLHAESVLSTYHEQLLSHKLFNEAAELRRLAYPAYPAVYEDFVKENTVHLKCGHCGKPMMANLESLHCESCRKTQEACPFCLEPNSPYGKHSNLRSACLVCGHGGHAECMEEWFVKVRGGGCCTVGCICDCVTGPLRDKKIAMLVAAEESREKGFVKKDELKVRESRAVSGARIELNK
ncbi:uncharacterized protein RCC_08097 [Ramularia collo-cygni]|uniref:Uncharacterized protein n=1 Tax=Ramularia collo-cygni TaxID=112498 RepID=A0A2D3V331_9PEZI|nr:uncharacterized protein RCC_08097 [Ramularia collo-cygni]CZT22228.1 uncharacterized protein RCC_08097 [Ramularia collo-cygni]